MSLPSQLETFDFGGSSVQARGEKRTRKKLRNWQRKTALLDHRRKKNVSNNRDMKRGKSPKGGDDLKEIKSVVVMHSTRPQEEKRKKPKIKNRVKILKVSVQQRGNDLVLVASALKATAPIRSEKEIKRKDFEKKHVRSIGVSLVKTKAGETVLKTKQLRPSDPAAEKFVDVIVLKSALDSSGSIKSNYKKIRVLEGSNQIADVEIGF